MWPTSSTSICRKWPMISFIASAVPAAPGRAAWRPPSSTAPSAPTCSAWRSSWASASSAVPAPPSPSSGGQQRKAFPGGGRAKARVEGDERQNVGLVAGGDHCRGQLQRVGGTQRVGTQNAESNALDLRAGVHGSPTARQLCQLLELLGGVPPFPTLAKGSGQR